VAWALAAVQRPGMDYASASQNGLDLCEATVVGFERWVARVGEVESVPELAGFEPRVQGLGLRE
jgi:hypothetical protein